MSNYSKYTYSKLLDYLHDSYLHDTERKDYAEYLLNMESETTLEGMIKIYNFVMMKLSKLICQYTTGDWYIFDFWLDKKDLAFDLHRCLNENISRLYFSQKNPSNTFCYKCLANLRFCDNINDIHNSIVDNQGNLDDNILQEIVKSREIIYRSKEDAFNFSPGTNGFKQIATTYLNCKDFLNGYGFIESVVESYFESQKGIAQQDGCTIIIIFFVIIAALIILFFFSKYILGIIVFILACLVFIPALFKGRL